jgi:pimeloyl-ACP methyl ester carboxylesterase
MGIELVSVRTNDGVRLDGVLTQPANASSNTLGIDAVILHHGVGGNFYRESFFSVLTSALVEQGCAVLRVNNRGHDLMYNVATGRLGAAYEVVDDCRHDWRAWLDFLQFRGYGRICLWGHSLGAVKTIHYLSTEEDARVPLAIAASPPLFSYADYMHKEKAEDFKRLYDKAQTLVESAAGDELLAVTIPTNIVVAARTYVDKYGPEERYNILDALPKVPVPILVTIGSEEGLGLHSSDWFPFGGLAQKVSDLSSQTQNLSFEMIEGANHAYAGREDALWSVAQRWVESLTAVKT